MDLEKILKEITSGLSGDKEKDMQYLKEQSEKYKEHEYAKEILRACGRLMFELIPDDKKKELERLIDNDAKGTEATIKEIRFNLSGSIVAEENYQNIFGYLFGGCI